MILVKFKFFNLPFERGKILFSKGFFDFTDIRKLRKRSKLYIRESFQTSLSAADAKRERRCRYTESLLFLSANGKLQNFAGNEKMCVTHERGRRKNTVPAETVWFTEAIFRKLLAFLLLM